MASSIHLILFSTLFFAAVASCSAFNVTEVLGPLAQFSTFSNYLAQVGVVGMMADLNNVTILAVDNANMGPVSGKSREEIKRAMTMHVIPEYYDLERLRSLPNGTALIRTVYVLTGLARGKDGMLLVTKRGKGGRLTFASAILPRSKPTVTLLRSVVVPSRNVSIFHVSGVIVSPPPVVSVASEGADFDAAGRIAVSSRLMVRREFPRKRGVNGGIKVGDLKPLKGDGEEDLNTSQKAEEKAPAKAPSKSPSKDASPTKSPAKAPAPSKSSNSTSGGKKGKSPAPSPSSDSPAPASSKKKSDGPSPAPSKNAPSKSPEGSKSPTGAKSSEPSPSGSSSGDSPAPAKSGKGGSSSSDSPSSDSPASESSPSPSGDSQSKSSPPAPAANSESPTSDSTTADGDAPAEAPSGGATPMTVTNVGIVMTVMALWALAA